MANKVREAWSNTVQNAEIAASSSAIFGDEQTDKENRSKYGSMNTLVLSNRSSYQIQLKLDDKIYTEITGHTTVIIGIEDGHFFDIIEVQNLDAGSAIAANNLTVRYGRSEILEV